MAKKRAASKKKASSLNRNENGLTEKQQDFANLYRGDPDCMGNAAACYRKLHPKAKDSTCEANGYKILRNAQVAAFLERKRLEAEKSADVTQARVLEELAHLVFLDPRDFFTEDGRLKRIHELDGRAARALASIETTRRRVPGSDREELEFEEVSKIRFWDKGSSIERAMKHLGMYERDNAQRANPIESLLDRIDGKTVGLPGGGR